MSLTAAEFESFAEEYDPIPFHVDEAVAARSQFDGITERVPHLRNQNPRRDGGVPVRSGSPTVGIVIGDLSRQEPATLATC